MKISKGLFYMMLAAFFFSLMAVSVKSLKSVIPSQEIVVGRSIVMVTIGIYLLRRRKVSILGNDRKLLFLRGFFGFLGLSAFFYTLTTIPIANSVVIQYTSPIFTALFAAVILKEKLNPKLWFAFGLAFLGVILVSKPTSGFIFWPSVLGVLGAACSGIAYNLVRKLRRSEDPINIILYLPMVSIPLSLPVVIPKFVMPQGSAWLLLLLVGIFTFIAQVFLTRGLHLEKAGKATMVSYITVVFSILFGWIFWGEIPDVMSAAGAVLILIAIYINTRVKDVAN
ncbi:MAG: DMT family transporter [Calditrichia bacterium]